MLFLTNSRFFLLFQLFLLSVTQARETFALDIVKVEDSVLEILEVMNCLNLGDKSSQVCFQVDFSSKSETLSSCLGFHRLATANATKLNKLAKFSMREFLSMSLSICNGFKTTCTE